MIYTDYTSNADFKKAREAIIRCRDARGESLELEDLDFERFPDEITELTDLKRLVIRIQSPIILY